MKQLTIREMASMGGHARAAKLSKKRLSEIGKKAINARWRKEREIMNNAMKGTHTQCKRRTKKH